MCILIRLIKKGRILFPFISPTCYIPMHRKVIFTAWTFYFVFSIAVLPYSPGVVYYHLLLRRESTIPGVAPSRNLGYVCA